MPALPSGAREFRKLSERRVFDAAEVDTQSVLVAFNDSSGAHVADSSFAGATVGQFRFVLGIRRAAVDISISQPDVSVAAHGGVFFSNSASWTGQVFTPGILVGYTVALLPGDYTINVTDPSNNNVLATASITIGNRRHTAAIIADDSGSLSIVTLDD